MLFIISGYLNVLLNPAIYFNGSCFVPRSEGSRVQGFKGSIAFGVQGIEEFSCAELAALG
jgi:hypothetical protein